MKQWDLMDEAAIPGSKEVLRLYRGKDDFFIRLSSLTGELMSTRRYASEEALGTLACRRCANPETAKVLIGGLGMGFTLAGALGVVGAGAHVTVAELIPQVVEWNRGPLGERSGFPLDDPRTRVHLGDVHRLLQESPGRFDVIAMDVDNGPEGLTLNGNDRLYSSRGIGAARKALKPGGTLAYWSASPDRRFHSRLRQCGLTVEQFRVFAHGNKGTRNTIWLASQG